jgi:hypothetical protein
MLRYVTRTPDDLFIATPQTKEALFAGITRAQGR